MAAAAVPAESVSSPAVAGHSKWVHFQWVHSGILADPFAAPAAAAAAVGAVVPVGRCWCDDDPGASAGSGGCYSGWSARWASGPRA